MPLLEAINISVRFGGIMAVDDASLAVEAGRVAALIGPNGAGKTTMFNVMTGLQKPTEGRVVFDDRDVTNDAVQLRARRGLARTFQRLEVFGSLTVRENILVAAEIHRGWNSKAADPRKVADEVVARVGLGAFRNQPADSVPTGVARLTELGRALAIEPRLLLLDEPSSGLNEEESDQFGDLLLELAREGTAVLMVEHDVDLVMSVAAWIDVLDFGKIIASGPPDVIQADANVQTAYLGATREDETDEVAV